MLGDDPKRDLNAGERAAFASYMNNSLREPAHDELLRRLTGAGSVFEFGCNHGKILAWARDELGARVSGLDVSRPAVELARSRGLDVHLGDDRDLPAAPEADVAITYYVLCHIPDISEIIAQLKRIAPRVLCVEAQEKRKGSPIDHWYVHDFKALGFKVVAGPFQRSTKAWMWEWNRPSE